MKKSNSYIHGASTSTTADNVYVSGHSRSVLVKCALLFSYKWHLYGQNGAKVFTMPIEVSHVKLSATLYMKQPLGKMCIVMCNVYYK